MTFGVAATFRELSLAVPEGSRARSVRGMGGVTALL